MAKNKPSEELTKRAHAAVCDSVGLLGLDPEDEAIVRAVLSVVIDEIAAGKACAEALRGLGHSTDWTLITTADEQSKNDAAHHAIVAYDAATKEN